MRKTKQKKNTGIRLVKKANKLVESRYKFDIWETRIFLSVLAQIKRNDEDFRVYRIWYKDLIKSFGLKSAQSYKLLRKAANGLMGKSLYVTNMEQGQRRETQYHIIRTVNYLMEGEKGGENQEYLDITIDPEMKPLLLQLGSNYRGESGENFTAYDLNYIIKLGAYHVRIYELLKQYQTIGHRRMKVEEIKRMLEITTEYPLFGNFFQKVIKPSVKAINKHTDLTITKLEKIKEGRKVVALYFEFNGNLIEPILKKDLASLSLPTKRAKSSSKKDELFNKYQAVVVNSFGVTPTVFLSLLDSMEEQEIEQAIRVTRRMKATNEIKKNVAGFFIKALKEGYTDTKEELRKKKAAQKEEDLARVQAINNRIREVVESNPAITEQAIAAAGKRKGWQKQILAKEQELGRPLVLEDYRQDVILRKLVMTMIIELAKDQFGDLLMK